MTQLEKVFINYLNPSLLAEYSSELQQSFPKCSDYTWSEKLFNFTDKKTDPEGLNNLIIVNIIKLLWHLGLLKGIYLLKSQLTPKAFLRVNMIKVTFY